MIVPFLLAAGALLGGAAPDYVAMGSSFAAGPGIGVRAEGSRPACLQSASNYPHRLAARLKLGLVDVSCSGATTQDILHAKSAAIPAQIDSVTVATRLVTVTIGGNDVYYMRNLWAWSCAADPDALPLLARLALCRAAPPAQVEQAFSGLTANLTAIVNSVHRLAPAARVVFVDYPVVLPDKGSCTQAPMHDADADTGREVARRLLEVTHAVARDTRSGLVSAAALTQGHDVCAPDPWMTGFRFTHGVDGFATLAYHPTQASMDAVAAALADYVAK